MKNTYNKLTCLFGHHDYSKTLTMDAGGHFIYLCKHCKRSGYYKWSDGVEGWFDYDKEGNLVREKWSNGIEIQCDYDKNGNIIHKKYSSGAELWVDNNDDWLDKKPKNWKYEKQI